MALGSTLSEQADVSVVVLRELLSSEPIDELRLSCYLEVASSWRLSCVLDYVHSGLHTVASLTNGSRISIKQAKKRNCSHKCSLSRALRYLEVVLKCPTMEQNLIANHYTQMEMFHTALLPLNNIIEVKLDDASRNVFKDRCQQISDGVILRAYEIRHTLSIIILNALEDEEKRRQMEELLEEDAAWIVNTIMVKLVSHKEHDEALFLVHFCQDALRLFSYRLGTYPHSTRFKRIMADSIVVLASKKTPAVFIISVLKTLKNLCRAADCLDDEELVLETIVPLTRSCLLWMSERIDDDDFDVKFSGWKYFCDCGATVSVIDDVADSPFCPAIITTHPKWCKHKWSTPSSADADDTNTQVGVPQPAVIARLPNEALVVMPVLPQAGPIIVGLSAKKQAQLFGLGLVKLWSRQKIG